MMLKCLAFVIIFALVPFFGSASQDAMDRLWLLKESDPELFRFILHFIENPDVPGGFDLDILSADLNCSEAFDEGFDSCSVAVDVSVTSLSKYPDQRSANVDVTCDVDLETKYSNSYFGNSESQNSSGSLYVSSGSFDRQTIDIDFRFFSFSPVVSARITDVSCEIEFIY